MRTVSSVLRLFRLAVPCLLAASPLASQASEPERPRLPRGADANDWEAYFDYGAGIVRTSPTRGEAAFYWASRLDPSRAEPLYARRIAFFLKDIGLYERYLGDDPDVLRRPAVRAADSLLWRAFERNPLVHRGLLAVLQSELPGEWRSDALTLGWLAYAESRFPDALRHFTRAAGGRHAFDARMGRALAFTSSSRFDSALVEVETLVAALRAEEAADERLVRPEESKEMLEYATGLLHLAVRRPGPAREAFQRALVENAAFAPARARLGDLALAQGDAAAAAEEYAQAVEVAPDDGVMRLHYGRALSAAGRHDDAVRELEKAAELEPHYAEVWLHLGVACDRLGRTADALAAYRHYAGHAPRREAAATERVRRRIAALEAAPPAP